MKYYLIPRENPQDRTQSKYYPQVFNLGRKTISDIAKEISARSSVSRSDVTATLMNLVEVLPQYLADGFSVSLDELGTLRPTLRSTGSDTTEDFSTDDIELHVMFYPGSKLKSELSSTSFSRISTSTLPAGLVGDTETA